MWWMTNIFIICTQRLFIILKNDCVVFCQYREIAHVVITFTIITQVIACKVKYCARQIVYLYCTRLSIMTQLTFLHCRIIILIHTILCVSTLSTRERDYKRARGGGISFSNFVMLTSSWHFALDELTTDKISWKNNETE